MEFIKNKTHFDFMSMRFIWAGITLVLAIASIYIWFAQGESKYGVDFKGGTEVIVRFNEDASIADIRNVFTKVGFEEITVQNFENSGRDFTIKMSLEQGSQESKDKFHSVLNSVKPSGYTILKEEYVGPIIGEQIRKDGALALFFSLLAILVYVAFRFEWSFGVGGIVALLHDVVIATGVCLFMGMQLSGGILAAMLTIIGFSINDTIVVYDRIRENLNKASKAASKKKVHQNEKKFLIEIMNTSINETLSRTILTSLTVFFTTLILWLFGGGAIADLSFALMIGVLVGVYSSVFVACPIVLLFQKEK